MYCTNYTVNTVCLDDSISTRMYISIESVMCYLYFSMCVLLYEHDSVHICMPSYLHVRMYCKYEETYQVRIIQNVHTIHTVQGHV